MKTVYIKRLDLFKNITLLLCNNITQADESFIENNYELFETLCDDCNGTGEKDGVECAECSGEGRFDCEIYQYYLTNVDDYQKEKLAEYGITLGYSNLLDLYVLPIYDFGTSWDAFSYSKQVADDYTLAYYETLTRSTCY
jgi:hypothetical protein